MHVVTHRILSGGLFAVALALGVTAPAAAQSTTGVCNLTVAELAFGEYDVFDVNRTRAVTRVQVNCQGGTGKTAPRVELSAGSSQDFTRRTQLSGSNVLTYNIYADQALTQVAGDGSSGTTALYLEPTGGGEEKVDLYGAIDPRQFAPPGSYFDTVYVTLIF
jgi:spore coat protein U-like protein